jgi:HAMP domain-containing protein
MTPENNLDIDKVLEKFDKKSSAARVASIALTLLSVLILAAVSFWTYRAVNNLKETEKLVQNGNAKAIALSEEVGNLEKQKESLKDTIHEAGNLLAGGGNTCNDKSVQKARLLLANASNVVVVNPKPVITPNTPKTPDKVTPTPAPDNPSIKVNVQITSDAQRGRIRQLIQKLGDDKFKFSGVELIKRAGRQTEVRYFHPEDEKSALELAAKLNNEGIQARTVYTKLRAEQGVLEIEFSNDVFGNKPPN